MSIDMIVLSILVLNWKHPNLGFNPKPINLYEKIKRSCFTFYCRLHAV